MLFPHRFEKNICIIELTGRLTNDRLSQLDDMIQECKSKPGLRGIVLNLEEFDFFDSSGLGKMISYSLGLKKQNCFFILCHLNNRVLESFRMTRLETKITCLSTEQEALAYLDSQASV